MANKENQRGTQIQRDDQVHNGRTRAAEILARLRRKSARQVLEEKIIEERREGISSPFLTETTVFPSTRAELEPHRESLAVSSEMNVNPPDTELETAPAPIESKDFSDPHGYIKQIEKSSLVKRILQVERVHDERTDVTLQLSDGNPCLLVLVSKYEAGRYLGAFNALHNISRDQTSAKLIEQRIVVVDTQDTRYSVLQNFEFRVQRLPK